MSPLEETITELHEIVESLPRDRIHEFDASMESVIEQVGPTLHTSRHQDRLLSQLQQVREDAKTAMTTTFDRIGDAVTTVCHEW